MNPKSRWVTNCEGSEAVSTISDFEKRHPGFFWNVTYDDVEEAPPENSSGRLDQSKRWPDDTIYYELDDDYGEQNEELIISAMWTIRRAMNMCITWELWDENGHSPNYVFFHNIEGGCKSYVGCKGKEQISILGPKCMQPAIVVHELLHTVGLYHEHQRTDRDKYVRYSPKNIINGTGSQFEIIKENDWKVYPYDYYSIMHYSRTAFSKNGKDTLTPLKTSVVDMGGIRMSDDDKEKVMGYYECKFGVLP